MSKISEFGGKKENLTAWDAAERSCKMRNEKYPLGDQLGAL